MLTLLAPPAASPAGRQSTRQQATPEPTWTASQKHRSRPTGRALSHVLAAPRCRAAAGTAHTAFGSRTTE
eukprot:9485387-Pyramimonas_sp.AAC.1